MKSLDGILKSLHKTLRDLDKLIDARTAKVSKNMAELARIEDENERALTEAKQAGRARSKIAGLIGTDDESAPD